MMSFYEFFTKTSTNLVLSTFLFYIEFVSDMSAMWEKRVKEMKASMVPNYKFV